MRGVTAALVTGRDVAALNVELARVGPALAGLHSVTVKFQSRWLGLAPWHEAKDYSYAVDRLDKATGTWRSVSSESFVGFTTVVAAGDGEICVAARSADAIR